MKFHSLLSPSTYKRLSAENAALGLKWLNELVEEVNHGRFNKYFKPCELNVFGEYSLTVKINLINPVIGEWK